MPIRFRHQRSAGRGRQTQPDPTPAARIGAKTECRGRLHGVGCGCDRPAGSGRGRLRETGLDPDTAGSPIAATTGRSTIGPRWGCVLSDSLERSTARSLARGADRAVIWLVVGYQKLLSPSFAAMGSQCRFEPSCSQYMIDAVQARGAVVGVALGLWRLVRCNPVNRGGFDPAPAHRRLARRDLARRDLAHGSPVEVSGQDVSRETF